MELIYKVKGKIKQLTPSIILHGINGIIDIFDSKKCRQEEVCLILLCDGGISSQLYQYVWGQILIDKGYNLKYDTSFFVKHGRDTLGRKNRFFLLNRMCKLERFETAPDFLVRHYKFRYLNMENQPPNPDWMYIEHNWHSPLYLGNYYKCEPDRFIQNIKKYVHLKAPNEVLNDKNLKIYNKIISQESVGVHIRRGDMAINTDRWKSPENNYFVRAISLNEMKGKSYYFFSDDISWVKNNIIPLLPMQESYVLVENGDEEAHQDLYLLSSCKYQIASQGSFGVVAFVLNNNQDKILIYPKDSRAENLERLNGERVIVLDGEGNRVS